MADKIQYDWLKLPEVPDPEFGIDFAAQAKKKAQAQIDTVTDGGYNWFVDPTGQTTGGKPASTQERDFIADYILKNNALPTQREVAGFMSGVTNQDFLADSTMGKLGFKTMDEYLKAQQQGMGTYGVNTSGGYGTNVPENDWIVATDAQGNPIGRMGRDNVLDDVGLGYLQRGQFIAPPQGTYTAPNFTVSEAMKNGGFTFGDEPALKSGITGSPDANKYYRQPTLGKDLAPKKFQNQAFTDLSYEDFLKTYQGENPEEYYAEQVKNILTGKVGQGLFSYEDLGWELEDIEEVLKKQDTARNKNLETLSAVLKAETDKKDKADPERIKQLQAQINQLSYTPEENITMERAQELLDANIRAGMPKDAALALFERHKQEARVTEIKAQIESMLTPDRKDMLESTLQSYLSQGIPLDQIQQRMSGLLAQFGIGEDAFSGTPKTEVLTQAWEDARKQNLVDWQNTANQGNQNFNATNQFNDALTTAQNAAAFNQMSSGMANQTPQIRYTGTEKQDFEGFVKNLKVSPNSQAWLYDNFADLATKWQTSGRTGQTLMQFIQEYLATGGWQNYQAPDNRNRLAPTTIYR